MTLDFNKVSYDGELSDLSEEKLREVVQKFEDAQESNVAEFKEAAKTIEGLDEGEIEDFEEAKDDLIEDITEADAFDEVPLTEDALEQSNFSELQEWHDFVATHSESDEDEEEETEFDDMGQKSPKFTEDETDDFVDESLGEVQGLNIS